MDTEPTTTRQGPKICLIGAGGMSFGPVMVLDAINTRRIRGATMMLHDVSPERLEVARRFADRVNERNGSPHHHRGLDSIPAEALAGADFCLTSAEVGRWQHWIEDYEIPVRHGATQITGENGGPGCRLPLAALHQDHARHLWRHRAVLPRRLPHQSDQPAEPGGAGRQHRHRHQEHQHVPRVRRRCRPHRPARCGSRSRRSRPRRRASTTSPSSPRSGGPTPARTSIRACGGCGRSGTSTTRRRSRPTARQLVKVPWVQMAVEQMYSPLVAHMFREYGLLPCSVDSHIGEYVPFAKEVAGWHPVPVYFHQGVMARGGADGHPLRQRGSRISPCTGPGGRPRRCFPSSGPSGRATPAHTQRGQCPQPRIRAQPARRSHRRGPGRRRRDGVAPSDVPPIIEPLAEFMRTQIELQELVVQAAIKGDPALAFEALRRDPLSPADEASCRKIFDELMVAAGRRRCRSECAVTPTDP